MENLKYHLLMSWEIKVNEPSTKRERCHNNCFDCPFQPDCKANTRDDKSMKADYINVGLIFADQQNLSP